MLPVYPIAFQDLFLGALILVTLSKLNVDGNSLDTLGRSWYGWNWLTLLEAMELLEMSMLNFKPSCVVYKWLGILAIEISCVNFTLRLLYLLLKMEFRQHVHMLQLLKILLSSNPFSRKLSYSHTPRKGNSSANWLAKLDAWTFLRLVSCIRLFKIVDFTAKEH